MATMPPSLTYAEAALVVLEESQEPLHYQEITRRILERGLIRSKGKTPDRTLNSILCNEIQSQGPRSRFQRTERGWFALASRRPRPSPSASPEAGQASSPPIPVSGLMVEDFPGYTDVRALLPLWISLSRGSLRRLCEDLTASAEDRFQAELGSPVDSWVLDNLEGEDRALARLIWEGSRRSVDPRNLSGFWQLIDGHRLLREDPGGHLRLGSTGRCFLENPGGRAEQEIDEREGLHRLLLLLGERTPLARGVLFDSWREFAVRRNRLPAGSSLRLAFLSRLKNLLARGLVERTRSDYRLTPEGYEHLTRSAATLQDVCQSHLALDLQKFLQEQRESILSTLRESLRQMSICRQALLLQDLFEEMGYEDLRPLDPIHEQRLELLGRIQDGISPLSVLIRFHSQTHPLGPDQILETRRSMDHWSAHRGCLVTTGSFTSEALALSLKEGQKPVSLVHGDHLVELLVQFGLGVQKRFVEVWELDLDGLNSDRAQ